MGIRALAGYVAHALLLTYWLWVVASTAPQLRKGMRDRQVRTHVLIIKTAALALTAVVVGIIHYWAFAHRVKTLDMRRRPHARRPPLHLRVDESPREPEVIARPAD